MKKVLLVSVLLGGLMVGCSQETDKISFDESVKMQELQETIKEHLKCLRLCASDARMSGDEEEHKFYIGLIKELKNDMREQLNWLDSDERYHMMENLAQSDFVKSIFKMKGSDK